MRLWLLTVFVLFALVQGFQWLKGVILPLPLYLLAGAFLAIASNYDKRQGNLLPRPTASDRSMPTATLMGNPQLPATPDTPPE